MILHCADLKRQYTKCLHRPVGPTGKYNCHGLTFASRRTAIEGPAVEKILRDDEYTEVQIDKVLIGDIVVYRRGPDVLHSGIMVRGFPELLVLSKWGSAHEVVHGVDDCEYPGNKTFYRIIDEPPRV